MSESFQMQSPVSPTADKEMGENITRLSSSSDGLDSEIITMPMTNETGKMTWAERWEDSKGMAFVLTAESCGSGMAATARLLEMDGGMSTLQIIFVRFSVTCLLSGLYMHFTSVPDFPLGKREVRSLLVLRGLGGFVGIYGFYYGLAYLPISEAIVIGFLIPILTAYSCSLFLHQPFDKRQLMAGLISFFGVVLIARPDQAWFSPSTDQNGVTPIQHLWAVAILLLSDLGATVAFTTIRIIGSRAHPVLSVNYYGVVSIVISGFLLFLPLSPQTSFTTPRGAHEWVLLLGLSIFGFGLQMLMTAGLVKDSSPRATNMMYSSIVFSLGMDWAIWGLVPRWTSWVGGGIVVCATVWAAMSKKVEAEKLGDEEYRVVAGEDDGH